MYLLNLKTLAYFMGWIRMNIKISKWDSIIAVLEEGTWKPVTIVYDSYLHPYRYSIWQSICIGDVAEVF